MPVLATFGGTSLRNFGLQAGSGSTTPAVGDFESIATVTVGAGDSQYIDFTSIPQTYTHLQIRIIARDSRATSGLGGELRLWFNSDTAANYSSHILYGTGATAASGAYTSSSYLYCFDTVSNSSTASVFSAGVIDILDYANANKYKTVRTLGGGDLNGSGVLTVSSGNWRNTGAITNVRLNVTSGTYNFKQYSSFALYGIAA
jgi:hypothetical protein